MLQFINRNWKQILVLIFIFAFATRIWRLANPERYIFDEVYHAITAKLIARDDPRAYEWWNKPVEPDTAVDWLHPPLAKYTQALGMLIFGENSFGWRISSVVFGVGVIALTALLAHTVFANPSITVLSALLASLDGLLLTQSRIAMNDIHVTFAILLALIVYWQYRQQRTTKLLLLSGLTAGLAMGTKWSGLFVLATMLLFEGFEYLQQLVIELNKARAKKDSTTNHTELLTQTALVTFRTTGRCLVLTLLAVTIYVSSYAHMFSQGKGWEHFYQLHQQIWWYQTSLTATHPYQSRPWQWFLNMRPVWYHVDYQTAETRANIFAFGNPLLFWSGAVAVVILLLQLLRSAWIKAHAAHIQGLLFILAAYLLVWAPWQVSPRIMFFYHYTPAVPLLCILLAYWLITQKSVSIRIAIVSACAATFFIWYPHWTAIHVPTNFAEKLYFATERWR